MPNHLICQRVRWLLLTIAVALSSVTALSVGMAMSTLIADPLLAAVFATAAVLLDFYKYLAWPIALGMLAAGKRAYAVLMIISALMLAVVSAWATYDRLLTSIVSGQTRYTAVTEQRMVDLQAVRSDGLRQLDSLDKDARSIGDQARQLRERGIVSKAQELESSALGRIDGQREQVLQRLDRASVELTELRAKPAASVGLPELLAILLCAGFAIALEAVPALIGSALRVGSLSAPPLPETMVSTTPATATTASENPAFGEQQDLFGSPDGALMQTLLDITRTVAPGTPISLRDFTTAARVGNRRAMKLFRAALDLGELRKTTAGYVTA
ncbi:hypothetical protein [Pseudomonas viridiflava]|uniref:hypothetical protein n=1 Tax=Pseudomonas viridiflava TaxID=33069 RepID=UPI0013C2D23D|nr:hypothetical protein [Pseudomonas viridiflava]